MYSPLHAWDVTAGRKLRSTKPDSVKMGYTKDTEETDLIASDSDDDVSDQGCGFWHTNSCATNGDEDTKFL